ncbi:MAG: three-Cys-motif partner protein TcmP, partial [Gemmataceae bacterium]
GFCGPGSYRGGEPGSPIVALRSAAQHTAGLTGKICFWFMDEREDRIAQLDQTLEREGRPAHFSVVTASGQFSSIVGDELGKIERTGHTIVPTFAFIDPFSWTGIPMSLIQRLLRQPRTEVFITLMVNRINQFLTAPQQREHMVETLGTEEALASVPAGEGGRLEAIRAVYQSRLRTAATFVRSFEMRDCRDRPIYDLVWAGNHGLGHRKMKEAMWAVDADGNFRFSDATHGQRIAFAQNDNQRPLLIDIQRRFGGQTVSGEQIRMFVDDETHYLNKHKTAALTTGETEGIIQVAPRKSDGKARTRGFPDTAVVTVARA